jgi:hypothetical protein
VARGIITVGQKFDAVAHGDAECLGVDIASEWRGQAPEAAEEAAKETHTTPYGRGSEDRGQ